MLTSLAVVSMLASPQWSVRWIHGERLVGQEPDLTAVAMLVHEDLVLVSEPYLPSHCGGVRTYRGAVAAFDRRTGSRRWTAPIPQATGDQAAFLRAWSVGGLAVLATHDHLVALDSRGRLRWRRRADQLPEGCRYGPTYFGSPEVRVGHAALLWEADGAEGLCRLDVRRGRAGRLAGTLAPAALRACGITADPGDELLGAVCDRGLYRVVWRSDATLLVQRLR